MTLTTAAIGESGLNQADHIATGRATLDAVRDAGNRWIFPEQLTGQPTGEFGAGLEPWGGVKQVWAFGSPQSGHGVDVTESFGAGVASLEAHAAYIEGLGDPDFDPREFLEGGARQAGTRLGVKFAAPFEVFGSG